jgi:CheY-like chemotaxis protein
VYDLVSFTQDVHDAFGRLYDRIYLSEHPLTRQLFGEGPLAAERLHRTLIDSLEWLRPLGGENPHHAEWRRYRHLQLRYVEGAAPESIARELLVSPRQARRDHAEALDELARLLWERLATASIPPSVAARNVAIPVSGALESELSKVAASADAAPTHIDELLRGVVDTARPLARARDVDVTLALEPDLPPVGISRSVMRQLLLNLLADAAERQPGFPLELSAQPTADGVDVVLRSRVHGAARSSLVSDETLQLAHRLARSQHVELLVGQTADRGEERTIVLQLPRLAARSLLLVDDNPDVGLLFRRFLADTSFRLTQARSADRALRLAREQQPDIIVLDVLLPSTDGWEVLQALRADLSTADIPVIVSSVLPDHAIARSLGVREFLPKPVTRSTLLAALARVGPRRSTLRPAPAPREASG